MSGQLRLRSNMLYALAGWAAPYSALICHLGAERFVVCNGYHCPSAERAGFGAGQFSA